MERTSFQIYPTPRRLSVWSARIMTNATRKCPISTAIEITPIIASTEDHAIELIWQVYPDLIRREISKIDLYNATQRNEVIAKHFELTLLTTEIWSKKDFISRTLLGPI